MITKFIHIIKLYIFYTFLYDRDKIEIKICFFFYCEIYLFIILYNIHLIYTFLV